MSNTSKYSAIYRELRDSIDEVNSAGEFYIVEAFASEDDLYRDKPCLMLGFEGGGVEYTADEGGNLHIPAGTYQLEFTVVGTYSGDTDAAQTGEIREKGFEIAEWIEEAVFGVQNNTGYYVHGLYEYRYTIINARVNNIAFTQSNIATTRGAVLAGGVLEFTIN